jgi:alpha-beta hydrolase superfamily lysophospholipase
VWTASKPRAVIVAVHGFNDYSNAFAMPGPWLAKRGVTVYAYDQRGFGKAPHLGFWAGEEVMAADLRTVARLVKERHRRLPLYVMGESMGGAVAMIAFAGAGVPDAEGVILSAPAVWGWRAMNPLYKSALWIAAHTVPSFSPTGEGLGVQASDNIEMLRALGRDPLVIKETRIDTIYGLVGLMDKAYESGSRIRKPVLYLYGKKDELVPREPTLDVARGIPGPVRFADYDNGWHMLLRDRQRERVWRDIESWIASRRRSLPSGEEVVDIAAAQ